MSTGSGRPRRFLLFSHDGFGLGHTRRHVAIAAALVELAPEACVLVATGADDIARTGLPPQVEILKLPALRKVANDRYVSRHLPLRPDEIHTLRSRLMGAVVDAFRPDVVLVDRHPFGIREELLDPLEAVRAAGGRAVLGLRDVLDSPASVRLEWVEAGLAERVLGCYEEVLVYGMRQIFDPVEVCGFPSALRTRTRFCGYIVNRGVSRMPCASVQPSSVRRERSRPLVLATIGGGEDGTFLLETFLRAAGRASWEGIAVAGPMTPEREMNRLHELASRSGVALQSVIPGLSGLLAAADAVVCMGGYNTLAEALVQGVPTVCVPRTSPRVEQAMRAATFERLGLLRVVSPETLAPETLAAAVDAALRTPRAELRTRVRATLDFTGAAAAARRLMALANVPRAPRSEGAIAAR